MAIRGSFKIWPSLMHITHHSLSETVNNELTSSIEHWAVFIHILQKKKQNRAIIYTYIYLKRLFTYSHTILPTCWGRESFWMKYKHHLLCVHTDFMPNVSHFPSEEGSAADCQSSQMEKKNYGIFKSPNLNSSLYLS